MKIGRIVIMIIVSLGVFSSHVDAKYVYNFDETVIELTRDGNPPVCNVSYSTEEWTNQNVVITITSNEEIEQVSGFTLSEDKKVLTKEVTENEAGTIKVRDFSGNCTEIEYNVSNIDKEAPQIIGCQNGKNYNKPLKLDYIDNVEIKEIFVDKYNERLSCVYRDVYYDSYYYYGINRNASTLTVEVNGHPKNTRKYRYYLNNKLYTTTTDTKYTFTGLTKGTTYTMKVEAIDKNGHVLDTYTNQVKTGYYNSITSQKSGNNFSARFNNLDASVSKIRYAVWNYYDKANTIWYDSTISNRTANINCTHFNKAYYASYVIHAYMYDSNNNVLDVVGFSIDFNNVYKEENTTIDIYKLIHSGNYQISVSDLAGNEIVYYIKVQ